jgi:hypothetical protein
VTKIGDLDQLLDLLAREVEFPVRLPSVAAIVFLPRTTIAPDLERRAALTAHTVPLVENELA